MKTTNDYFPRGIGQGSAGWFSMWMGHEKQFVNALPQTPDRPVPDGVCALSALLVPPVAHAEKLFVSGYPFCRCKHTNGSPVSTTMRQARTFRRTQNCGPHSHLLRFWPGSLLCAFPCQLTRCSFCTPLVNMGSSFVSPPSLWHPTRCSVLGCAPHSLDSEGSGRCRCASLEAHPSDKPSGPEKKRANTGALNAFWARLSLLASPTSSFVGPVARRPRTWR